MTTELLEPTEAHPAALGDPRLGWRVFNLAWPVMLEMLLQTLLGVVDTMMVGQLGAEAIAGVGIAQQFLYFAIACLGAISVGSSILVAQASGAKDYTGATRVAKQSLVLAALASFPLALIGLLLARPLVGILGVTGSVVDIGGSYLEIILGTAFVLVVPFGASAILRGLGDTRTPLQGTIVANVVNFVLAYLLIFGHFGFPQMGIVGSAWAAVAGRTCLLLIVLFALWRGRAGLSIRGWHGWRLQLDLVRRIVGLGAPAALEQFLMAAGFTVLLSIVARLGTDALAANWIALMALDVGFVPSFGLAIAATTLVGQAIGARRPAEGQAATYIAIRFAVGWMFGFMVVYLFLSRPFLALFTPDPTVVDQAAACLIPISLALPLWAIQMVANGGLRGAGDTRFPLIMNATMMWGNNVLAFIALIVLGWGLPFAWAGFIVFALPIAGLSLWRFRAGNWRDRAYVPIA